ncbi:ABC transporter substrate-binding protein [Paenibacillus radicis (ex Xue et al. 2023)]|uniref:Sugar ABC transporter substrate-binding protein n=1 Tax=Paenibacillus radicis (ex Xue et al. 2023) TaxID=2972489 RepID=A0ABT1YCS3_9BACL|nr:sugar ABC transporter substrate-binding protein [Paenibacillus radicis (ex Xue et al. 2023)]MCR8630983.1 sugar ABC transporter substrate-binding protein [Paenibacillus radicis (ex Xue et al. 2023)]
MLIKMSKLHAVVTSTLLSLSLLLTACSGGGTGAGAGGAVPASDKGSGSSTTPAATATGNDASKNEPITLTIVSTTILEKPEATVEQAIADEFMKQHPNVKIQFVGVPMNDLFAKLTTMATGKQLPDIFTNTPDFVAKAEEMGITADMSKLLGDDFLKGFYPSNLKEATFKDKLQFMPWFTAPTALLYRADWFQEKGLKPPTTWDEFRDAAKALTEPGKRWGFALVGSKNGSGAGRFMHILRSYGVEELREENGKWVTDMDKPQAIEALKMFGELYTKDKVAPPGPTQVSYAEAVTLMATEKTGMIVTGPHSTGAIYAQNPNLKGKLGSVPLPKAANGGKHVTTLGELGFSISSGSKNQKMAVEYLKFLVSKDNAVKFNETTGRMPTRTEAGDLVKSSATFAGFVQALEYVVNFPQVPYLPKVQDILGEAYQALLTEQATPEAAAKKAAQAIRDEIQKSSK